MSIATSLGITTVAEGVETQEQAEVLAALGCTEAQGFLFSRPLPPEELDTKLVELGLAPAKHLRAVPLLPTRRSAPPPEARLASTLTMPRRRRSLHYCQRAAPHRRRESPSMQIRVFSATASGPTPLAAFDRALQVGGTHDTNLIVLSSVVPVGASVVRDWPGPGSSAPATGSSASWPSNGSPSPVPRPGRGSAWAADTEGRGGLFVEAHGHSEQQVRFDLEQTLEAIIADRPYWTFGDRDLELAGTMCEGQPACALVMAIYESAPWST